MVIPYQERRTIEQVVRAMSVYKVAVNVLDHGADPTGRADSTAAIQESQAAAEALGQKALLVFAPGKYLISAAINWTTSNVRWLGAGPGSTWLYPTHTAGNVIYVNAGSVPQNIEIADMLIQASTIAADNTLVGINNNNGQRLKLTRVRIHQCATGVRINKDCSVLEDCCISYNTTGLSLTNLAHATVIRGGVYEQCTTAIVVAGCAGVQIDGPVIQTNTTGVSVGANTYGLSARAYFEDNDTHVAINGAAANTKAFGVSVSGYLNHNDAAAPAISLAYCGQVDLSSLYVEGIASVGHVVSIGDGVEGLNLGAVTNEWYPYIAPNHTPAICGPVSRRNQLRNGAMDHWTEGATAAPNGWTLYNCTVAQTTDDDRDGENIAALTSTGAGGGMYRDIPIPPAYRIAGMLAIVVADVKYVSGTAAELSLTPLDAAGNTQGSARSRTTTSDAWTTLTTRPVIIGASATKLRVALYPDSANTSGVSRFARVAVYYGATPWPFERSYEPLTGVVTWNPGSLDAGAQATTTVTVTGATLGDVVSVGFSKDLAGLQLTGYVSAANTVTVVLQNGTAGAVDLAEGALTAYCWQY